MNILRANFLWESALPAFFYLHVTREKLLKRLSYKKCVRKMLMKLTQRVVFKRSISHEENKIPVLYFEAFKKFLKYWN